MGGQQPERGAHISDDLLELYALNRLSGDQLAAVEEHLLMCAWCQDRLEETDVYVRAMQGALRKLEGQQNAGARRAFGSGQRSATITSIVR